MLKTIKYSVTFNSTLKEFKGEHDFKKGLTAVTGPNESGKSLIVEMIRYSLFGTKALRATSSSYMRLQTELSFVVADKEYTVKRGNTGAITLSQGNATVACGTKQVNAAIERVLGYNLEVFDISNACLQGEVEALSNKKPADRKRMVEKVIGLDAIEKLIKQTSQTLSDDKRSSETLKSTMVELTMPIVPLKYILTTELTTHIEKLEKDYKEKVALEAWLNVSRIIEPVDTCALTIKDSLEDLQTQQAEYQRLCALQSSLVNQVFPLHKELPVVKNTDFAARRIAVQNWATFKHNFDLYTEPDMPKEYVQEQKDLLNLIAVEEKRASINRYLDGAAISCPECSHKFHMADASINSLKAQLAELPIEVSVDEEPTLTAQEIAAYEQQWLTYDNRPNTIVVVDPNDSLEDINRQEKELEEYELYLMLKPKLDTVIDALTRTNSMSDIIELKVKETARLLAFKEEEKKYKAYIIKKVETERELAKHVGVEKLLNSLREVYPESLKYELDMAQWLKDSSVMLERQKQIDKLEEQININENIRKGLKDLKPKVKMYLVPSLNKVASVLVTQMTQGERTTIVVDEEFNIKVDGQSIEELSGSGKSVANLAIRIALGTVLTNKTFSVFLADEVDAAMDEHRAAYTAEALRNLKSTIDQIVIVSHQKPDADYQIELRK